MNLSALGEARKHLSADLSRQKPVTQRNQAIVVEYGSPLFSDSMLASRFWKTVALGATHCTHQRGETTVLDFPYSSIFQSLLLLMLFVE